MKKNCLYVALFALSVMMCPTVEAQDVSGLAGKAAELCRRYDFSAAAELLAGAVEGADSASLVVLEPLLDEALNGENMARFCGNPVAVARKRVSLDDFYLYFPLADRAWRPVPNQLDSVGGRYASAVYVPVDADRIYYSTPDGNGVRNIMASALEDRVWTAPALPGDVFASAGNEIYPMLSPDGKSLYFASDGYYGMGGYDLYVSRLDGQTGQWSAPENLGFPYSSPYNDYMFINTADGRYSVFASDRGCPPDSVCIYVVEYDAMPVRTAVVSAAALRELSSLVPAGAAGKSGDVDAGTEKYLAAFEKVEKLKAEVEKGSFSQELQDRLKKAKDELKDIEMTLLLEGRSVDPEKLRAGKKPDGGQYVFQKLDFGTALKLEMLPPEPKFDYTLRILDEGRFAEDNTLPDGLVYQIQMISLSKQATVQQLKGVSPVFYRKGSSGYLVHYAGLFHSYAEAQEGLSLVKRAGFPKAFVAAFNDGKQITVQKARELEKAAAGLYQIRIVPADGRSLSEKERSTILAVSDKDLARVAGENGNVYLLGPYSSQREAELVVTGLVAGGLSSVEMEQIEQ